MPYTFSNFERVCKHGEPGCQLEAAPRKQRCYECWERAQPPVVRAIAAERRLSLIPESARLATVPKREWPEGRRWCAGCQTFRLEIDCTGSRCKPCNSIASAKARNKARFGIDDQTYQWLFEKQLGKCAICRQEPKTVRLAIDHDHGHCKDGCPVCVRGLLCSRCNHELLGAAHDSIHILRNAVNYLDSPPMLGDWPIPQAELETWRERYGDTEPAPY